MPFDAKKYRNNRDALGAVDDDKATDATSAWTQISLLKGLYHLLSSTGITVAGVATAAKQDLQIAQETAAATSLAILDDWDESDRAKVNLIAGQAGIAAGAGAVGATVPRITLASDDPAVAVLGAVGDAAATAGSTGSISAKLRLVTTQLNTLAGYLDGVEGLLGGTLTVGTHAVTQSGTWTVQPGNTANTTAWLVTGTGGTFPATQSGSWSVTANAGTNLNTSLLALEGGGNLAAIAASASVLDDWDESDRAKVNIIAGQAGVAAGAGSVGATVQRVTLASDDPLVALQTASSASLTSLNSSASSAQLLAANSSRKGLILTNTDANAVLVKYGTTASATSYTVRIENGGYWEMPQPIYTGRIDAIWEADGSGALIATEM